MHIFLIHRYGSSAILLSSLGFFCEPHSEQR